MDVSEQLPVFPAEQFSPIGKRIGSRRDDGPPNMHDFLCITG